MELPSQWVAEEVSARRVKITAPNKAETRRFWASLAAVGVLTPFAAMLFLLGAQGFGLALMCWPIGLGLSAISGFSALRALAARGRLKFGVMLELDAGSQRVRGWPVADSLANSFVRAPIDEPLSKLKSVELVRHPDGTPPWCEVQLLLEPGALKLQGPEAWSRNGRLSEAEGRLQPLTDALKRLLT